MTESSQTSPVRSMWHLLEPVHALLYFAPEASAEAAAVGLTAESRWAGYFAWRAAPLPRPDGVPAPTADAVTEAFYSFSPDMVRRYVPDVWAAVPPQVVLPARERAADAALRAVLGERVEAPDTAEAAMLARRAAEAVEPDAGPLTAGNAVLPWPEPPHLVLWHAATLLREHRGDVHIAALREAGLDPCEALVSFAAVGAAPVEVFASRGWTDQEWAAAEKRLAERGLVDGAGQATAEGRRVRAEVERITDERAAAPWRALGPGAARLAGLLMPLTQTVVRSRLLPARSTLGIGR